MSQHIVLPGQTAYTPFFCEITEVSEITEKEKLIRLKMPKGLKLDHLPCQFVMVSVFGFGEAPISICSGPDDEDLLLCVRRVGKLTSYLHSMKPGQMLGIRGPYGNGFPLGKLMGKDLLFIAGGLGLAPLRSLIRYVLNRREEFGSFTLLYGSKTEKDRLFIDEIEDWKKDEGVIFHETLDIADQDWHGNVGLITMLFRFIDPDPENTIGFVIGPPVMYRFVIRELLKKKIPIENIYMDLERRMRCGLGKCGHCQLNGDYVCQDGPVFNYAQMIESELREAL